jgi:16S rRNA (adenine1518-N6/adenine1519-N6)-dimethyltransferase
VANLPYSITTPLIARLLEDVHPVRPLESIVVMVQKEMAERISAAPGTKDYSSFGILVEYYAEAEVLDRVPANAFFPTPRVDSTILKLSLRSTPAVEVIDRQLFFDVVRAGFAHRRKTLANALAAAGNALSLTKEEARSALRSASIDPRKRAERLSIKQFGCLADNVYQVQEQEA